MKAYNAVTKVWVQVQTINFNISDGSVSEIITVDGDEKILVASDEELEHMAISSTVKHNIHLLS